MAERFFWPLAVAIVAAIVVEILSFGDTFLESFADPSFYQQQALQLEQEVEELRSKNEEVHLRRLVLGVKGNQVKTLQRLLHAMNYTDDEGNELEINGIYDDNTKEAVVQVQKTFGVKLESNYEGICSDKTWTAILNAE